MPENENSNSESPKSSTHSFQMSPIESTKEYLTDINRMLGYCRDQGIAVPGNLESDIGSVHFMAEGKALDAESFTAIVRLHGKLSVLIAPATPRSLAATEFYLSNKRAYSTYVLLVFLILMAFVGLVGYMLTLELRTSPEELIVPVKLPFVVPDANTTAHLQHSLYIQSNYLCAAVLGAAFSGLLTMYRYLRNRSFEPNYVAIYIIRFVVGVLAGVVLANLGSELFKGDSTITKLGPGIIALLGGYSAEAVRQILDRLVEVLVTVVRGKDAAAEERLTVAKDVLAIAQDAAADSKTPSNVRDKIDGLLKKLQR